MYCVNCGVRLADTEKACPLCGTQAYHPDMKRGEVPPLYPKGRMAKKAPRSKGIHGVILMFFLFPILVSFVSDWQFDHHLQWCGYVAGSLILAYVFFALPLWFRRPNPVIFMPCNVVATALFLWYVNWATHGAWFVSFALPITAGCGVVLCALITLLRYLKKGRLFIWGGWFMALGALVLLVEYLLGVTFAIPFIGWSLYPLAVLVFLGALLIYLGINRTARETMQRKLFF